MAAPLIILAQSGRALAEAARAAGMVPHVIDRFGDTDTRAAAETTVCVPVSRAGHLDEASVMVAVARLTQGARVPELVWGGGLEAQPQLLSRLRQSCRVRGSALEGVKLLHDRAALMQSCVRLGIPTACSLRLPGLPRYLRKRAAAAGGDHIRAMPPGGLPSRARGEYDELFIEGIAGSVTLLAYRFGACILGFNRLLTHGAGFARNYRYLGAVGHLALTPAQIALCARAGDLIARAWGWRGLCGLDFVLTPEQRLVFVDFNPRPVATFDLHLDPGAAFAAHLAACRGHSIGVTTCSGIRGHRLVEALDPIQIPNSLDWPSWVSDRPGPGERLAAGVPICTVRAEAADADAVHALLETRAAEITRRLAIAGKA